MKNGLLRTTALAGTSALLAGGAAAAEAPEWKLSGNMNFQFYWIDQDFNTITFSGELIISGVPVSSVWLDTDGSPGIQDHGWYFGVDEAELQIDVEGTADNGLNYGFKIEINANTTDPDPGVADEARIQLSGSWGTLQLGDEDGAEDTMNYGGESLMGATGGFDGDFDDVLLRHSSLWAGNERWVAPSYPTIVGDTGDSTKVTYYSPRFSGFQVGASITPTTNDGDDFKSDGYFENHYGLGANYDNTFGNLRLRASAVYSAASSNFTNIEDIAAWSAGGIVGWGPFSLGANYTDNGESGSQTGNYANESSYWNVAAGFETGSMYFSAGYFSSIREYTTGGAAAVFEGITFETISLTADYTIAPGLGVYAEIDLIEDRRQQIGRPWCENTNNCNDATIFIAGANVSF